MTTHVLFEGTPGILLDEPGLVIEGVALDDLVAAARRAAAGATRLELCGGLPVTDAAAVRAAVGSEIAVRVNRYGFESLEQVAAYKTGFAEGAEVGDGAFFYAAERSTPLQRHDGVLLAGVASDADLTARVREAQALGAGIVELYHGLGIAAAAVAREATDHALPVGFID